MASTNDASAEGGAVGGDIVYRLLMDDRTIEYAHVFTNTASASTFSISETSLIAGKAMRVLAVAGGGSGGNDSGGGGGAGGLYMDDARVFNAGEYTITIGTGGAAWTTAGTAHHGDDGGDSLIALGDTDVIRVKGGGGGGTWDANLGRAGNSGGSGGGGSCIASNGGATTQRSETSYGLGYAGGGGLTPVSYGEIGGGGGGAGGPGGAATAERAGNGGAGVTCDIMGESVVYAQGGAGAGYSWIPAGYGGGDTSNTYGNGGDSANTGFAAAPFPSAGGGGGGGGRNVYRHSGAGANGIVVIRYKIPAALGEDVTSGMYDGRIYYQFFASGTFNVLYAVKAHIVTTRTDGSETASDVFFSAGAHPIAVADDEMVTIRIDAIRTSPLVKPSADLGTVVFDGFHDYCLLDDYDTDFMDLTGNVVASGAGSYEFTVSPKPGLTWSDGTSDSVTCRRSIAKATLAVSEFRVNGWQWDGDVVPPVLISTPELDDNCYRYDISADGGATWEEWVPSKAIGVGNYQMRLVVYSNPNFTIPDDWIAMDGGGYVNPSLTRDFRIWEYDEKLGMPAYLRYHAVFTVTTTNEFEGALENFPMLVRVSDATVPGIYRTTQSDLSDIRFTLPGDPDMQLPFEIDTWNTAGESLIWVRVPEYKPGAQVVMNWGLLANSDGSAKDIPEKSTVSVWADYAGVWHLNEEIAAADTATTASADATGNGNDAVPMRYQTQGDFSVMVSQQGVFGNSRVIGKPNSNNDYTRLQVPDFDNSQIINSSFTWSAWISQTANAAAALFSTKTASSATAAGWEGRMEYNYYTLDVTGYGNNPTAAARISQYGINNGGFIHVTVVYNVTTEGTCTVDVHSHGAHSGVGKWSTTGTTINRPTETTGLAFGGNLSTGRTFFGAFDEIRLRKGAVSAEWAEEEYQQSIGTCTPGVLYVTPDSNPGELSPAVPLAEALNTNLVWTTEGDALWRGVARESLTDSRDAWAVVSGLCDDGAAAIQTRVFGSGVLTFDWAISSEKDFDWMELTVDGVVRDYISGECGWQSGAVEIAGSGWHIVRWEYFKNEMDDSGLAGENIARLDNVVWLSGGTPPSVTETLTTPVHVPYAELDTRFKPYLDAASGDYEAAALMVGRNGCAIWQSYVAGLDPDEENSKFTAIIEMLPDGTPNIAWEPDTPELRETRTYTIYGKKTLIDKKWTPVTDENKELFNFFKVDVGLR